MADPTTEAQEGQQAETTIESSEFSGLLQKEFKPKTDRAREAVEEAVQTLAEQVLRDTGVISSDVVKTIEALVGEIDRKLSGQVNEILHNALAARIHRAREMLKSTLKGKDFF